MNNRDKLFSEGIALLDRIRRSKPDEKPERYADFSALHTKYKIDDMQLFINEWKKELDIKDLPELKIATTTRVEQATRAQQVSAQQAWDKNNKLFIEGIRLIDTIRQLPHFKPELYHDFSALHTLKKFSEMHSFMEKLKITTYEKELLRLISEAEQAKVSSTPTKTLSPEANKLFAEGIALLDKQRLKAELYSEFSALHSQEKIEEMKLFIDNLYRIQISAPEVKTPVPKMGTMEMDSGLRQNDSPPVKSSFFSCFPMFKKTQKKPALSFQKTTDDYYLIKQNYDLFAAPPPSIQSKLPAPLTPSPQTPKKVTKRSARTELNQMQEDKKKPTEPVIEKENPRRLAHA